MKVQQKFKTYRRNPIEKNNENDEFLVWRIMLKFIVKTKILASIFFCLCFCPATPGQTTLSVETKNTNSSNSEEKMIYVFLSPFEKRDAIEIEESCLILLRDVPLKMRFPSGRTIKTSLAAGTKYFVPKGKYEIENLTDSYVEYQLLSPDICRE